MPIDKVLDEETLLTLLGEAQHAGKRIVTTNGCFDVLHLGHLRYLESASQLGDVLVVLLNGDRSVSTLKGPNRPIVPETERAEMVAGLGCVDFVTLFHKDTPIELLERIRPHVHVKGAEYSSQTLPEAPHLEGMGTELVFLPMVDGRSTTQIIQKIVDAYRTPV